MRILAVDTAEQSSSVALVEDGTIICEEFFTNRLTHSRTLMNMISHVVEKRAGISIDDIDGFVTSCGPGSFTGLRIGISIVKGLAYATGRPAAGISSLDAIAGQFINITIPVCIMMDAKRGEVYCAVYIFKNGRLFSKTDELVIAPESALKMAFSTLSGFHKTDAVNSDVSGSNNKNVTENVSEEQKQFSNFSILFAGSGASEYRSMIEKEMGSSALFAPEFQNSIRASTLAREVFGGNAGLSFEHDAITPVYLRRSDAEINYEQSKRCFC